MENQSDPKVNDVVSALVLVAAVVFAANVYISYSEEQEVVLYEEIESSYSQTASAFISLREAKAELAAEASMGAGDTVEETDEDETAPEQY